MKHLLLFGLSSVGLVGCDTVEYLGLSVYRANTMDSVTCDVKCDGDVLKMSEVLLPKGRYSIALKLEYPLRREHADNYFRGVKPTFAVVSPAGGVTILGSDVGSAAGADYISLDGCCVVESDYSGEVVLRFADGDAEVLNSLRSVRKCIFNKLNP